VNSVGPEQYWHLEGSQIVILDHALSPPDLAGNGAAALDGEVEDESRQVVAAEQE
jgi:hypothetical protein